MAESILITPRKIFNTPLVVELPRSKSMLNRYLMMYALQYRNLPPDDFSAEADDVKLMRETLQQILLLDSHSESFPVLHCGNAGTVARMGAVLAAFLGCDATITGVPRLLERPMSELIDMLMQAGVNTVCTDRTGFPPLQIQGNGFTHNQWHIHASQSSQHLSALLLTGPFVSKGITVYLPDKMASRPYIDMTISMMRDAGAQVIASPGVIRVGEGGYPILTPPTEADWSSAAFVLQAIALMPEGTQVIIKNLKKTGIQGDEAAEHLFALLGVQILDHPEGVVAVNVGLPANTLSADLSKTPDLFNAFAITAAMCHVHASIVYPKHLVFKESDRLGELANALKSNGFDFALTQKILALSPRMKPYPHSLTFDSAGDHRIAMSCALAGIKYPTIVANPHVVSKSFPDFFNQFSQVADVRMA